MMRSRSLTRLLVLLPFAVLYHPSSALANPFLRQAATFTVLAGSAMTCTDSNIAGDVGATVITQVNCAISDTVRDPARHALAYRHFLDAYVALASVPCTQTLTGTLAGVTLQPGVYCFDAAATLTGRLTLMGNGVWIFKVGAALTGTDFSVVLAGGQPCNVYWRAAAAATMTTSNLKGTILAGADITATGTTLSGDVLAGGAGSSLVPTGAVTLTNARVGGCGSSGLVSPEGE
jgi:ice-binding like protein